MTAVTDDHGQVTRYAYDGLDRLILRTDALDNTMAYTYDGNNKLVQTVATERQPDGLAPAETFTTLYAYDAANRLVETTDNLGQTTRYGYDSRGNLVFRSDANGAIMTNDERQMTNDVGPSSFVVGPSNDHGNTALYTYDGLNRRLSETYHLRAGGVGSGAVIGQVTMAYAYDDNGNLVQRADPNGNVTAYSYDGLDRLVHASYADGAIESYAYDQAGNLIQHRDANGSVIAHTYDALNRRIRTEVTRGAGVGGVTLQTLVWDGLSRLVAATDNNDPNDPGDDSVLGFTYDSLSNRREETQDGHTVHSTYDGMGNRLSLAYPGGTVLTYTYDALNRVKTLADGSGTLAGYDYLGPWRVLRRTNGNGTYVTYSYDGARRIAGIAHRQSSDNALLTGFGYTYDRAGNRLTETAQPDNRQTTYTYDSLYRLVGFQRPDLSQTFAYDAAGNRTRVTRNGQATPYTVNTVNEYLAVGSETRAYDANGNLRLVSRRASSERHLYLPLLLKGGAPSTMLAAPAEASTGGFAATATVTETVISYRYDFNDRLLGVTKAVTITTDGNPQVTTEIVRFTYDALGRPVTRQAENGRERYLYAGGQVVEERDGTDVLLATYVGALTMERGGNRLFYQTDALGSVRALADDTGGIVERVDYEPFGTPAFSGDGQESAVGNPFLFRGRHYDAGSGLYAYSGRRYEPSTGRYLQRGDETLGNPYTFAGNNPVRPAVR